MVPRRDDEQSLINGPDGEPIPDHTLGEFTFKRPTVMDLRDIGLRRSQSLAGTPPADQQTAVLVEIYAVLPFQVKTAPKGWDWQEQYNIWDMVAIYEAYRDGVDAYATNGRQAAKAEVEDPIDGIGDPGTIKLEKEWTKG
jgi:hypothetical protein